MTILRLKKPLARHVFVLPNCRFAVETLYCGPRRIENPSLERQRAFQSLYRRLLPGLGHNKAVWAVARRLCRLLWKILHQTLD